MSQGREVQTRREFLTRGVTLAAVAATVPSFLSRAAYALDDPAAREARRGDGRDEPILVVLQLAGGNDGLNTVVPYADDLYHRVRPTLAIQAEEVLRIDDHLGLHPALAPLKALYDDGGLAILQAVGYPNPNRSHFRSMEIWETASDSDKYARYGWIGRYFDNCCAGEDRDPAVGLRVGRQMPQAFSNASSVGISLQVPEQYRWVPSDREPARQRAAFEALNRPSAGAFPALDFLQRTALNAHLSSDRIGELAKQHRDAADYPETRFAQDLRLIAQMIAGGLGTRVYYATLGGFDTHATQAEEHARLLADLAGALAAFVKDLKAQGNLERVLILAFSEFGRRVQENGSRGTDHGAAGLMLAAGAGVVPGLHGQAPRLTDLDRGDLKHAIDFRSVYATVLSRWLKVDPAKVLDRRFAELEFLKTS